MNRHLADDFVWALPATLLAAQPSWRSMGFSTRLSRHVSLRESWGQRVPSSWTPAEQGTLYLNPDALMFIGSTANSSVDYSDVVAADRSDGGRGLGEFVVLHLRHGRPVAFSGGPSVCDAVKDLVSSTGKFTEITSAFLSGPEHRSSLEDRLPPAHRLPLDVVSHRELVDLEDFWLMESDTVVQELTAVSLMLDLGRTQLSGLKTTLNAYLEIVSSIIVGIDAEMRRRPGNGVSSARHEKNTALMDAHLGRTSPRR